MYKVNIPGVSLSFIPQVAESLDEMNNRRSSVGADGRVAECQTSRSCWRRLPLAVAAWPPPPNAHNFFASTVSIPSSIPLFLSLAARLVHQCKYPLGLDPHQHPPGCVQQIGAEFGSRLPSVPSRCRSDSRRLFTAARVTPTRARFSPRDPARTQLISSDPPVVRVNSFSSSEPTPGLRPSLETSLCLSPLRLGQIGPLEGEAGTGIPGME